MSFRGSSVRRGRLTGLCWRHAKEPRGFSFSGMALPQILQGLPRLRIAAFLRVTKKVKSDFPDQFTGQGENISRIITRLMAARNLRPSDTIRLTMGLMEKHQLFATSMAGNGSNCRALIDLKIRSRSICQKATSLKRNWLNYSNSLIKNCCSDSTIYHD